MSMPHIHNQPGEHDLTASAFIIRTDGPEPKVVLHHHLKAGVLLQFGGHIELNENPWQGLVRELREESGYEVEQLKVLQPPNSFKNNFDGSLIHPLPFSLNTHRFMHENHFHSDLAYAMTTHQDPVGLLDARESSSIHQYTLAQLAALPSDEIYDQTRSHASFILKRLLRQWEAIAANTWPVG